MMKNQNAKDGAEAKKSVELHLLVEYLFRPIATPISKGCVHAGITANAVTIMGGALWFCSIPMLLVGADVYSAHIALGAALVGTAAFLWVFGFLLDVVDGGVARLTNTSGLAGSYLDLCFHLLFNPLFLSALGCFLYIVDPLHVIVPILGVLGSSGNWGPTVAALEQVTIANAAANKRTSKDECLINLVAIRGHEREAGARRRGVVRQLSEEIMYFPGQFVLFFASIISDLFLPKIMGLEFPITLCLFLISCIILILSLPFRMYREFCFAKRLESGAQAAD